MSRTSRLVALGAVLTGVLANSAWAADGFHPWTDEQARKPRDVIEAVAVTNVTPYYLTYARVLKDVNVMERAAGVADLTPWYLIEHTRKAS